MTSQSLPLCKVVVFPIVQEPNQYIGEWILEEVYPQATIEYPFKAIPEPSVTGFSLNDIRTAVNVHCKGVSAKKIIVIP